MGCNKYPNSNCAPCENNTQDASCTFYTGPTLTCSSIEDGDSIEVALQKIDEILCSSAGDYSTYQMGCLRDYWNVPILTEATFVQAISTYVCQLKSDYNTFVSNTYPNAINGINTSINTITNPNITCASAGVNNSDDIVSILQKYCTKFSSIDTALNISSVVWNNCQTVPVAPTTIAGGFQVLADQICAIEAGQQSLPTFSNVGSCLPAPLTNNDSLVTTINKIKTRLCQSPTYASTNISWGCVGVPGSTTSIELGLQQIINKVQTLTQASTTFDSGDFIVTATDPMDACAGVTVSLATPINVDRFVASTPSDVSPGTLQDKLQAGTSISLDYITTPGKVIINSAGSADNFTVKAETTDNAPGFLIDKLGGSGQAGLSINPSYNGTSKKVDLILSVDPSTLFDVLLDELISNNALYAKFCERTRNCPSPCDAPSNVQAVQISGTTSTTTTTLSP